MGTADKATAWCPHSCLSPCSTCEGSYAFRELRELRTKLLVIEGFVRSWQLGNDAEVAMKNIADRFTPVPLASEVQK